MEDFKLDDVVIDEIGNCSSESSNSNLNEEVIKSYLSSSSMADLACLTDCCGCKNIC